MSTFRTAADCLERGRRLRLEGNITSAHRQEKRGEDLLTCTTKSHADELLAAWENSLAESPVELEEWRNTTNAYSQLELLEAGYLERLPHQTGGGL